MFALVACWSLAVDHRRTDLGSSASPLEGRLRDERRGLCVLLAAGATMGLPVPPRVNIAERILFDEDIRKILRAFDAYARAELTKGSEPSPARFHALRGKELGFSLDSLKRWLSLRRRFSER